MPLAWPTPVMPASQMPRAQGYAQQPTQWQVPPAKVRGVSAEVVKFVLPSPETLGVSTNLPLPAKTPVDWNQIQARMAQLKVLSYDKDRPQPGLVRVKMVFPTNDPTRGQPVVAQAETEAAAIVMALDAAEAWMRKQ